MILMQYDFFILLFWSFLCSVIICDEKGTLNMHRNRIFLQFFNIFLIFFFIIFFFYKKKMKKKLKERRIWYCLNRICVRSAQFQSFRLSLVCCWEFIIIVTVHQKSIDRTMQLCDVEFLLLFWCAIFVRKINGFEVFSFVSLSFLWVKLEILYYLLIHFCSISMFRSFLLFVSV